MEYRNELKFELSAFDLIRVKNRLHPLMHPDTHQSANGYLIKSLYFDDLYNSCAFEKESGVPYREKYRIRIYNNDPGYIHLEKKIKYVDMCKKESQLLALSDYETLLSGNIDGLHTILSRNRDNLLTELVIKILTDKFSPKCIVTYERFAFVEKMGNVRITFDYNIAGSRQTNSLFDPALFTVPIMPQNHHILEIKYDELLPHYILAALDFGHLQKLSFSKYYMTRAALG